MDRENINTKIYIFEEFICSCCGENVEELLDLDIDTRELIVNLISAILIYKNRDIIRTNQQNN